MTVFTDAQALVNAAQQKLVDTPVLAARAAVEALARTARVVDIRGSDTAPVVTYVAAPALSMGSQANINSQMRTLTGPKPTTAMATRADILAFNETAKPAPKTFYHTPGQGYSVPMGSEEDTYNKSQMLSTKAGAARLALVDAGVDPFSAQGKEYINSIVANASSIWDQGKIASASRVAEVGRLQGNQIDKQNAFEADMKAQGYSLMEIEGKTQWGKMVTNPATVEGTKEWYAEQIAQRNAEAKANTVATPKGQTMVLQGIDARTGSGFGSPMAVEVPVNVPYPELLKTNETQLLAKIAGATTNKARMSAQNDLDNYYMNQQVIARTPKTFSEVAGMAILYNPLEATGDRARIGSEITHQALSGGTPNVKFWKDVAGGEPTLRAVYGGVDPYVQVAARNMAQNPLYAKMPTPVLYSGLPASVFNVPSLAEVRNQMLPGVTGQQLLTNKFLNPGSGRLALADSQPKSVLAGTGIGNMLAPPVQKPQPAPGIDPATGLKRPFISVGKSQPVAGTNSMPGFGIIPQLGSKAIGSVKVTGEEPVTISPWAMGIVDKLTLGTKPKGVDLFKMNIADIAMKSFRSGTGSIFGTVDAWGKSAPVMKDIYAWSSSVKPVSFIVNQPFVQEGLYVAGVTDQYRRESEKIAKSGFGANVTAYEKSLAGYNTNATILAGIRDPFLADVSAFEKKYPANVPVKSQAEFDAAKAQYDSLVGRQDAVDSGFAALDSEYTRLITRKTQLDAEVSPFLKAEAASKAANKNINSGIENKDLATGGISSWFQGGINLYNERITNPASEAMKGLPLQGGKVASAVVAVPTYLWGLPMLLPIIEQSVRNPSKVPARFTNFLGEQGVAGLNDPVGFSATFAAQTVTFKAAGKPLGNLIEKANLPTIKYGKFDLPITPPKGYVAPKPKALPPEYKPVLTSIDIDGVITKLPEQAFKPIVKNAPQPYISTWKGLVLDKGFLSDFGKKAGPYEGKRALIGLSSETGMRVPTGIWVGTKGLVKYGDTISPRINGAISILGTGEVAITPLKLTALEKTLSKAPQELATIKAVMELRNAVTKYPDLITKKETFGQTPPTSMSPEAHKAVMKVLESDPANVSLYGSLVGRTYLGEGGRLSVADVDALIHPKVMGALSEKAWRAYLDVDAGVGTYTVSKVIKTSKVFGSSKPLVETKFTATINSGVNAGKVSTLETVKSVLTGNRVTGTPIGKSGHALDLHPSAAAATQNVKIAGTTLGTIDIGKLIWGKSTIGNPPVGALNIGKRGISVTIEATDRFKDAFDLYSFSRTAAADAFRNPKIPYKQAVSLSQASDVLKGRIEAGAKVQGKAGQGLTKFLSEMKDPMLLPDVVKARMDRALASTKPKTKMFSMIVPIPVEFIEKASGYGSSLFNDLGKKSNAGPLKTAAYGISALATKTPTYSIPGYKVNNRGTPYKVALPKAYGYKVPTSPGVSSPGVSTPSKVVTKIVKTSPYPGEVAKPYKVDVPKPYKIETPPPYKVTPPPVYDPAVSTYTPKIVPPYAVKTPPPYDPSKPTTYKPELPKPYVVKTPPPYNPELPKPYNPEMPKPYNPNLPGKTPPPVPGLPYRPQMPNTDYYKPPKKTVKAKAFREKTKIKLPEVVTKAFFESTLGYLKNTKEVKSQSTFDSLMHMTTTGRKVTLKTPKKVTKVSASGKLPVVRVLQEKVKVVKAVVRKEKPLKGTKTHRKRTR